MLDNLRLCSAAAIALFLTAGTGLAQNVITTLAGTDSVFTGDGKPAIQAQLGRVSCVAVDAAGNVYTGDSENHLVYRIEKDGILTVVAGNGISGYTGDGGPATLASFATPVLVATDPQGDLFIGDPISLVTRRVNPSGIASTVAASTATANPFPVGNSLAAGPDGTPYYIGNGSIYRIKNGVSQLYAGGGASTADGPALSVSIAAAGIAIDGAGNVFLTDSGTGLIRQVTIDGKVKTIAGGGASTQEGVPGFQTQFRFPSGIAVDRQGNIYVAEKAIVRRFGTDGLVRTVAGTRVAGFSGDGGLATQASIGVTLGLATDPSGSLIIADSDNQRVRVVSASGVMQTIAGVGQTRYSGDGGPAINASFGTIGGIAIDNKGNVYVSDSTNHRLRVVGIDGVIRTVAGTGAAGDSGDEGPGLSATLFTPSGLATAANGDVFIADRSTGVRRIRRLDTNGVMHAAVGKRGGGDPASFNYPISALNMQIGDPFSMAFDSSGNLIFLDAAYNQSAMVVSLANNTIIGAFRCVGFSQCPPVQAIGVDVTSSYHLVVGTQITMGKDNYAYVAVPASGVYRIESNGTMTILAGNGKFVPPFDGTDGLTFDPNGNLVFTDNFSIYRIVGGVPTLIAGGPNASVQSLGDGGLASAAGLFPTSPAYDANGNLLFADQISQRVRMILAKPPAIQAGPAQLNFSAAAGGAPTLPQNLNITAAIPGVGFTATVDANSASWLTVSAGSGGTPRLLDVTADPGKLSQGTYSGTITIASPTATPATSTIKVSFTVAAGLAPALAVDAQSLSFSLPRTGSAQTQKLTISNPGGSTLNFTVATAVASPAGGKWLSASLATGQATPAAPAIVDIVADPASMSPGTYTGTITVSGAGSPVTIPVTMTISTLSQAILLSQRGLSFIAVAQGGVIPPQTFAVRNIGTGVVQWTTSTKVPGGGTWLQVSPASGSSDAAQAPPLVTVSVSITGLQPGAYYGLVQVNAPAAANSPQVLTVFLQVLSAGSDPGPALDKGSLVFTATTGGPSPGSQSLQVYNVAASAKSFRSVVSGDVGLSIATLPTDAVLDPQHPTQIVVQPFTGSLASGVYNGTVTLQFSDGRVRRINVKVIVSKTGGGGAAGTARSKVLSGNPEAPACTPTKLVPALISLVDSFQLPTGLPVKLDAYVKDDCGTPIDAGSVKVSFSNHDTPASLIPLTGGLWEGQWLTQNGALSAVSLKLHAENGGLIGDQPVSGSLDALQTPPAFDAGGIVSAFGISAYQPVSPGEVIAIYGAQLAGDASVTSGTPLPVQWAGTQVFVSGGNNVLLPLPLYYVSPGQVNALLPYAVSVNTPLQLVVQRGATFSLPVTINLAAAQPAIFSGAGAITAYPSSGAAPYTVTTASPAHAGDTVVMYCVGLGPVDQTVQDGGVPSGLAQTVNPLQVQFGSQTVKASFAGLNSQFPGLYQVNVVVPQGTGTGTIPVILSIAGQSSVPINMPIQ